MRRPWVSHQSVHNALEFTGTPVRAEITIVRHGIRVV